MIKSKVISVNINNLNMDIDRFRLTGKEITRLECNVFTAKILLNSYRDLFYHQGILVDFNDGRIALYNDIPLYINDLLDDGTIGIC